MRPGDSDDTRGRHFRALLRSRGATYALVLGIPAVVLAGIALDDPRVAFGGAAAVAAIVVVACFLVAQRRAARDFFAGYAERRGWTYSDRGSIIALTPLLGAGHRRRFEHMMSGPLGSATAPPCQTALYTYEIVKQSGEDRGERKEAHHFTLCAVDVPVAMAAFGSGGIYLRPKRGLIDSVGDDHLDGFSVRQLQVESALFADRYDLLVEPDMDEIMVRRLLAPTLVDWLAEHPLRPCFELRAGALVVYVPELLDGTGRLDFFLDAATHLTQRVLAETSQSVPA